LGRPTTTEKLRKIHERAIREFHRTEEAQREVRRQSAEDRRFAVDAGAQWDGWLGEQFENKPKLESNKVRLSLLRIYNEYRNNRITVDFIPADGADEETADICDGLFRADEQDSVAEEAYDLAFDEAVAGGFGAWRIRADEEDEEDEDNEQQRSRFEPIPEADKSVWWDLDAKRQDKSDASRCWVISLLTRERYEEEYDRTPSPFPYDDLDTHYEWCTPDFVAVAEYYERETVPETVHVYRGVLDDEVRHTDEELEDDPTLADTLAATGYREIRQRKIKRKKVHKYVIDGADVLEDEGYIAGKHIPIVPVYGQRWFRNGVEHFCGHVRHSKDPARVKNVQLSKLLEISALSSVEKPILTPDEIGQYSEMWRQDNVKNFPYLLRNRETDQNGTPVLAPIEYTKAPNVPPALIALMQIAESDLQEVLGSQQAGEQLQPNQSGKAVELIQQRLDMQVFIYVSNMAKAHRRSGQIWLSQNQEILVEPDRRMKVVTDQGGVDYADINTAVIDPKTKQAYTKGDLSRISDDVVVDVGPSFASRKAATVRGITGLMAITADPQMQSVLGMIAAQNMDGEGISEAREYFRKRLVRMGVYDPTEADKAEMAQEQQGQQPDPQAEYLKSAAAQAEAEGAKARADTVLTIAKAAETKAKTEQTTVETQIAVSEHGLAARRQGFDELRGIHDMSQTEQAPTQPQ
jgi:hypothetical protein